MFLLSRLLRRMITSGELHITDAAGTLHRFGSPAAGTAPVQIRFADTGTPWRIARNPALGAGEAFMDGRLLVPDDDIRPLLNLIAGNLRWDRDNATRVGLWNQARIAAKIDQINFARRSKRNVAHHYDLSDTLYDLFLDADRQYSCAYFAPGTTDLATAQADKKAHIAAKLMLQPGHKVLDIGCGWGGMALYLHRVSGADVTGITLSEEQLKVARRRAAQAGVADHVRFELIDYRAMPGTFDRIVSVGMFEHVGRPHYHQFFEKVASLLAADGVALIHSIGRVGGPGATDPWTAKYIFPGGYTPALSEVLPAVERAWLWPTDIEILRLHYARTLEAWYDACVAQRAAIEALYDARFYRMWLFYLWGARNAFQFDDHMVFQLQLARRRDTLPITRDYMMAAG
jgi:cyclopropane-fatty-acyl-phospholipid synthase